MKKPDPAKKTHTLEPEELPLFSRAFNETATQQVEQQAIFTQTPPPLRSHAQDAFPLPLRRAARSEKSHTSAEANNTALTLLCVTFHGWTASPRQPRFLSGDAVVMPVPSYPMLLGLIGCCLGREVSPEEVRVGFEYQADDVTSTDLETSHRLEYKKGRVRPHPEGTAVKKREFHSHPHLTLFIDRPDWKEFFVSPVGIPNLGQSQDLLWIKPSSIREIRATSLEEGYLGKTLLPFVSPSLPGRILRLAESYEEGDIGEGRRIRYSGAFTALHPPKHPLKLPHLFHVGDILQGRAVYLHEWFAVR
jgi:CRISPR-associated protein Cas5t